MGFPPTDNLLEKLTVSMILIFPDDEALYTHSIVSLVPLLELVTSIICGTSVKRFNLIYYVGEVMTFQELDQFSGFIDVLRF